MHKYIIFLFSFLLFISFLSAQENHMDIMTTMTGEHDYSQLGWVMTTLDWNGDDYDDLIINERGWKLPDSTNYYTMGKLLIYLGSPSFDNLPEITIPGHYPGEYVRTIAMCNAGHFNNDNFEDLALIRATPYVNHNIQDFDLQLCVYNGSANTDSIPDYVLTFPREQWDNGFAVLASLGDINHDGFDDIGYVMRPANHLDPLLFGMIYGLTNQNVSLMSAGMNNGVGKIIGLGDVNADNIDDFVIGYWHTFNSLEYHRNVLYFGNESGIYCDSLVLGDSSDINSINSFPAGDVNRDGIADFVSNYTNSNGKLFFGSTDFDATSFIYVAPPYQGDIFSTSFGHGDVNGNGVDDLMGSAFSWANGYGVAGFWEGGVPMNGGLDLQIESPVQSWLGMFGWCLTMGDYNGDGCCDAAISAPFDNHGGYYLGYVYVYAGNTDLNDPSPISDDTATPAISKMLLYPNPLNPQLSNMNIKFTDDLPTHPRPLSCTQKRGDLTFEIYNIRGQKVKSFILTAEQSKLGSASFNLNDLSSGVYICILMDNKHELKGKITIIR